MSYYFLKEKAAVGRVVVCIIAIILLFSSAVYSQNQQAFVNMNKYRDLSGSSVTSITQGENGFIWIGTKNGLSRYDGYSFKEYKQEVGGLSADDVSAVLVDSRNRMWVGTIGGLDLLNPNTDRFIGFKHSPGNDKTISSNEINTIFEDSEGGIWIGSEKGLNKFVEQDSSFLRFTSRKNDPSSLSHNSVKSIFEDANGHLWIGTFGGGLNKFDKRGQKFVHFGSNAAQNAALAPRYINAISSLSKEELLIGTSGDGLLSFNSQTKLFRPFFQHDKALGAISIIRTIYKASENDVWVGTDGDGLLKISMLRADTPRVEQYSKNNQVQNSLSSNAIYSIFVDHASNVWVGTAWNGINILEREEPGVRHYYSDFQGVNPAPVLSVFKRGEELWFGTDGLGLNIYNFATSKLRSYSKEDIGADYIQLIKKRQAGGYFVGTFANGLLLFDPEKGVSKHFKHRLNDENSLSYNDVRDVVEEENGDFWVASWGGGLGYYHSAEDKFISYRKAENKPTALNSDNATCLAKTLDGKLWIGTFGGGLNLLDPQTGEFTYFLSRQDDQHSISSNNIISLLPDRHGYLWIGSWDQGLCRLNLRTRQIERFNEKNGLKEKTATALLEDEEGNIWLSTKKGIYKFEYDQERFLRYVQLDGEYHINSAFKGDKLLYFGGNEGVVSFNPAEIEDLTEAPKIVFTGFKLFNKEVKAGEQGIYDENILQENFIELKHNHSVVTFEFAALEFPFANHEYAIKLENFDENWREIGTQRSATYTNLEPGHYTFKVKARVPGGVWGSTYKEIEVIIHKPFWKMWWAYLLYVILFSFLLYLFYRYTIQWEKLKNRLKVEKITREKERELHKLKLKFFTNVSHEIRTPVTLLLGAINRVEEEGPNHVRQNSFREIRKNGHHLLQLVNELLDFRKLDSGGIRLKAAKGNFVKFVKEIYLSFSSHAADKNISFLFISEKEDIELWYDRDQMEKVVYNLLSNAIKFTGAGGTIKVQVSQKERHVQLVVEDTGMGIPENTLKKIFKRFYQSDNSRSVHKEEGFGIGLSIAKGVIKLHAGTIEVESELNKGSKFVVQLPCGADHLSSEQKLSIFKDSESVDSYAMEAPDLHTDQLMIKEFAGAGILVVEDNEGIRNYLIQLLQPFFEVKAACNGQEAFDMAVAQVPDLIISDVMMPEKDGISLTRELKKDIRTSHIPVILLTARTSLIFKKEGLETGADDYVTKPFSETLLKTRIVNLLKNRQLLREKFQLELATEPKDIAITTPDHDFLAALTSVLEENLDNADLRAEFIAKEIGISHSVIYKKIKSLSGLSLVEFIRDFRLKRAAQLLTKYNMSVLDVCLKVGFTDRKYFSQVFKKRFGKTPTDFAKNQGKDQFYA